MRKVFVNHTIFLSEEIFNLQLLNIASTTRYISPIEIYVRILIQKSVFTNTLRTDRLIHKTIRAAPIPILQVRTKYCY